MPAAALSETVRPPEPRFAESAGRSRSSTREWDPSLGERRSRTPGGGDGRVDRAPRPRATLRACRACVSRPWHAETTTMLIDPRHLFATDAPVSRDDQLALIARGRADGFQ